MSLLLTKEEPLGFLQDLESTVVRRSMLGRLLSTRTDFYTYNILLNLKSIQHRQDRSERWS